MNNQEVGQKVNAAMYCLCKERGYAAPVDVLMEIGALQKKKYEDWRAGRVLYLEAVCDMNLNKLSFVMHQIRVYARENGLKPSVCCYKRWGAKKSGRGDKTLRFSKSGDPGIERWYATHFVDSERMKQLKAEKEE